MTDPESKAEFYRQFARECLTLAEHVSDDVVRRSYAEIAEYYLELAKEVVEEKPSG
jgi:hypothetical protein